MLIRSALGTGGPIETRPETLVAIYCLLLAALSLAALGEARNVVEEYQVSVRDPVSQTEKTKAGVDTGAGLLGLQCSRSS
jgi:hypothetical protein